MNGQELKPFLEKLASGDHTNEEYREFARWAESCSREEYGQMLLIWEELVEAGESFEAVDQRLVENIERGLDRIDENKNSPVMPLYPEIEKKKALWPRIAAAASIILALTAGGYLMLHKTNTAQYSASNLKNDIKPGHNQATLTLANGRKIILTKNLSGQLATQGNMLIKVNSGNAITYTMSEKATPSAAVLAIAYNTISTGKGEQLPYPLVLADGSRVMLNAMSSITFPTSFNAKDRTVKITGEAYFEVKHDPQHPFRVTAGDRTIEDIGTQFDINAYDDEPGFKTTLIDGAVKVTQGSQSALLKPGQQAVIQDKRIAVKEVDVENEIAWRSGKFRSDGEKLDEIMRQAARWYDVDVVYENDALRDQTFGIIGNRYANVSELLHSLELTQKVKFKITGRKITVLNK